MEEISLGTVVHYFHKPMVAAVKIENGLLALGDVVHFKGRTTDLHHRVDSLQIENQPVGTGRSGDVVGIRVAGRVRARDRVAKVVE